MPYSTLPSVGNNPLANLKTIAEDTVIYVSTTGNDGTGDGSVSAPYATLSRAMDVARESIIVGNATLTIRLLKGNYPLDTNIDLYHPQGNNLVIEGDPAAFAQRVISSVSSYASSLSFLNRGTSFRVALWNGATTGNALNHGFTTSGSASNLNNISNGYFTITNGRLGSRSDYSGDGIAVNAPNSYSMLFHGDRFFNHGCCYEYSGAVMGIGRFNTTFSLPLNEVDVYTYNIGYDGRCPAWHNGGGINNTVSWGGVASNYPETQY